MSRANGIDRTRDPIVIAGGGLAGQRCAETLRREGYEGPIQMVCAEPRQPYDRPALSKDLLLGAVAAESLCYRSAVWYAQHDVELLLGVGAIGLRPRERRIVLAGRRTLRYAQLLIATGSRPRTLPALAGYENVSVLRTLDDALRLREALGRHPRLAVIGAGFIGQEVAASARRLGASVMLIEAGACPLETVLGPRLGRWFAALHRAEGVQLLTGCAVERVAGNGSVERLYLTSGLVLHADHVVVGVGVRSNTDWLNGSPLENATGVPVDHTGRTRVAGVLAAGDAAATFDPILGRYVPGSHWEVAARQGAQAARAMLGLPPAPIGQTSFWTDQYGIRIQYLGRARPDDAVTVEGDPDARSFTATFSRGGRPVAALLVDRARSLPAFRTLIEKGAA
jgi:3-phenylpropionate/trans-cinnamate dioxygenase ferredoxin reductase subunit